jgi:hypothetical protein
MSNYTKLTDFASKDTLPSGNAAKIVKATEIDDELVAIETAIASKANEDSPALTGTPTAPTAASGTNTTQIATTAFVSTAVSNTSTLSAWTIVESGTDLIFKYNGTAIMKLTSAGAFTVIDDITAYGTI